MRETREQKAQRLARESGRLVTEMLAALELAEHWLRIAPLEGLEATHRKTLTAIKSALAKARGIA